ncbi:SpoIIE family protein phosphatase [Streptomyces sp. NPDC059785]|uniref:SpoIIE family protein phosphatase n=1 Tax=unclassified Streptomyces TaxID=2593676 RepID=UPI00365B5D96
MGPVLPFDEADTARAVVDDNGVLRRWNEGARRLLGHAPEDVLDRPAAGLLASGGPLPSGPDGDRWTGTVGLRHRDGSTVTTWLYARRRPPRDGGAPDWLVVRPLVDGVPDPAEDDALFPAALTQGPCATSVLDDRLRLRGINDAMAAIAGLPPDRVRGMRLSDINPGLEYAELEQRMHEVIASGTGRDVETFSRTGGEEHAHAWLVSLSPVTDAAGRVRGVCLAAHDFSDQYRARERLHLVNTASVRIGSTLDVTRTAQELADVCVPALADFVSVDLLDPGDQPGDPGTHRITAPVTLRRAAHRSARPGSPEAVVAPGQCEVYPESSPQADSLLAGRTVVASGGCPPETEWPDWDRRLDGKGRRYGIHSVMSVPIQARGTTLGVAVLSRFRRPDRFTSEDVLLAEEVTARAAVCIDNARRFSRERETALALQRSLLPRSLPRTAAVEAASRYLPAARAGVGGDWFDVIQLSGTRIAMVVGDVVGHGIQASATMGRLRTAVRTLADIDLAPEELLTYLDDLVVRLAEEAGNDGTTGGLGATCLYAVYDPVSRGCAIARAGHPPPMLLPPDGPPREIDVPAGPPLGLGGMPFESVELTLSAGSVLALYTDGLVDSRRDPDAGRDTLCEVLGRATGSLDQTCHDILHALLPTGGALDDVALLLARTRELPPSQVAAWDIPAEPSLVAPVRKRVLEQLDAWGLTEAGFTVELVVSELVTNAIRYGEHPIGLRLIHDGAVLICEVSDSSHTAPHLRRARTMDEGGRGLLLVAQLTQRWGSRHTAGGKTIWAEIPLTDP